MGKKDDKVCNSLMYLNQGCRKGRGAGISLGHYEYDQGPENGISQDLSNEPS